MRLAQLASSLPPRNRRVLALTVVPMLALASLGLLLEPIWYSFAAQRDWRAEVRKTFASAAHATQSQTSLQEQLGSLQASALWTKLYPAASDSSAGASLQADVSAVLRAQQVEPQMLTPLATSAEGQFKKIGTRFTCSARIDQVQKILAALATHSRYLRVERLKISAPQSQQANENAPLAIVLDVSGYQLIRGAAPTSDSISAGVRP